MSLLIAAPAGFVLGLLVFFLLPFASAQTGWRGPTRMLLVLATMPVRRLAIVVSEHNDVIARPMSFDALGVERITIDGDTKAFEDPANRLHSWLGIPFAFADEETGTLFDPRDAAMGAEKRRFDERNEAAFVATQEEYDESGIDKWVPGAFTLPDAFQMCDLSAASELVDGGERSEYPERTEQLYKHSRDPFGDGMQLMRLFLPVLAFMGTFGGIWLLASQLGAPSGGGGSTVAFGAALLAAGATRRLRLDDVPGRDSDQDPLDDVTTDDDATAHGDRGSDRLTRVRTWLRDQQQSLLAGGGGGDDDDDGPDILTRIRDWASDHRRALLAVVAGLGVLTLGGAAVVGMVLLLGLLSVIAAVVTFIAGLLAVPVVAQLGRVSERVGGWFSGLFFKQAFLGYRDPVLVWTPKRYELREQDKLSDVAPDPTYYSIFGARVGFSFEPGAESFGEAGATSDGLDAYTDAIVADGGESKSNVPSQRYAKAPELGPDRFGGFVESGTSRGDYGVLTDIAMGWWANSADGTKSMRQLLQAKEKFGGDEPAVSDKTIAYLTAAMGGVGAVLGIVIFLL
jgi:hypothetical protein